MVDKLSYPQLVNAGFLHHQQYPTIITTQGHKVTRSQFCGLSLDLLKYQSMIVHSILGFTFISTCFSTWATFKTLMTFQDNGWWMGIPRMRIITTFLGSIIPYAYNKKATRVFRRSLTLVICTPEHRQHWTLSLWHEAWKSCLDNDWILKFQDFTKSSPSNWVVVSIPPNKNQQKITNPP